MSSRILNFLWPSIIGVTVYIIVDRLFPEKKETFKKDPLKDLRGGEKENLVKQITERILNDRSLKIALFSVFSAAGYRHFQSEIEALLINDVFNQICVRNVDGQLKVVCDIIQEHELNLHTKSIRSLIVSKALTDEQKISLLKIKLDFIINGECGGKVRFLIVAILGAIFTLTVSGVGGVALILEALYQLFKEGRIGEALYKQVLKSLAKKWGAENVPIEHLLD